MKCRSRAHRPAGKRAGGSAQPQGASPQHSGAAESTSGAGVGGRAAVDAPQGVVDVGGGGRHVSAPYVTVAVAVRVHSGVHEVHAHQVLRIGDGPAVGAVRIRREVTLGNLVGSQRAPTRGLLRVGVRVALRVQGLVGAQGSAPVIVLGAAAVGASIVGRELDVAAIEILFRALWK